MDPKQLLLEHFEKAVLGGAAVWLIMVLVGMAGSPEALSKNDALQKNIEQVARYMKGGPEEAPAKKSFVDKLERQLSPDEVAQAEGFPEWALHRRPGFLYYVKAAAPKHSATHAPPVGINAEAKERGKISVSWQASLENEYIIVEEYVVERKVGEDGEWEEVTRTGGLDTQYEDTNIQARKSYYYRVTSVAAIDRDNPVVRHETMILDDAETQKLGAEAGPIETARDFYVLPITVTQVTFDDKVANPDAEESAYLKVFKWDAEGGNFVGQTFTVKVGEMIGAKKKKRGREIDFSTGAELVDVEIRTRKHRLGHDEQLQVVKYRFSDGSEEEANDRDKPEELKDAR